MQRERAGRRQIRKLTTKKEPEKYAVNVRYLPIFAKLHSSSSSKNNNSDSRSNSFRDYSRTNVQKKKCFASATCISRRPAIKHHPTRRQAAAAAEPSSSYRVRRPIDYSVLDNIGMGGFAAAAAARGQRKEEAEEADKKRSILCRHDQEQCV